MGEIIKRVKNKVDLDPFDLFQAPTSTNAGNKEATFLFCVPRGIKSQKA